MNQLSRVLAACAAVAAVACSDDVASISEPGEPPAVADTLTGTHWWVEDIDGGGVIDRARTTIGFFEEGRAGGNTGCNRWNGTVTIDGERIAFGPAAATRRMCPPALMDQEQRFLDALTRVESVEIPPTGLLHLKDASGETVLRAARLREGEEA